MKWFLDDTKRNNVVGEYGLMSPMISLKRYLHEKFFLLYLSFAGRIHLVSPSFSISAVAELPTKDVDS